MNFEYTSEQTQLRAMVRDFAASEIAPHVLEWDENQIFPLDAIKKAGELGLLGAIFPEDLGGAGLGYIDYAIIIEELARVDPSVALIIAAHNSLCTNHIFLAGTEEQKRRYIPKLAVGEWIGCWSLTEPEAGTGADLRCTVEREGGTYFLSGKKHMITFGSVCDYWLLFARVAGSVGAQGTVALLVPRDIKGARVEVMPESMGVRGSDHARLEFDGAPVPVAHRVGEEGQGLEVALGGFLAPSRISVAMSCVGLARRAHELAVDHARHRETFGKALADRQAIAFMIAEMATEIEAARQLALHAGRLWEGGANTSRKLSSMSKLFAVSMLQRVTDQALQIHGGLGYWEPHPIERIYRDARAQRFEEGTNEIQKTVIAREILKRRM